MISLSRENAKGNNQGITVPIDPNVIPLNAPTMTKDFNSIRAYLIPHISGYRQNKKQLQNWCFKISDFTSEYT